MQLPSFWRDLGAEFRRAAGLRCGQTQTRRIDSTRPSTVKSAAAMHHFALNLRHLASRGGLALYSGRGLGSDLS